MPKHLLMLQIKNKNYKLITNNQSLILSYIYILHVYIYIKDLVVIIVGYVGTRDIYIKEVLDLGWDIKMISKLDVSYLSLIVNNHPDKINHAELAMNPNLTPDLVDEVKNEYEFTYSPLYPKNKLINNGNVLWQNSNLQYNKLIAGKKHEISWSLLGTNPKLSYNEIKLYRFKIGLINVAKHPNSGDLLLEVIKCGTKGEIAHALRNPSFPFDKISTKEWRNFVSDDLIDVAFNPKLPMDIIRKYQGLLFNYEGLCLKNENIMEIMKEFPRQLNEQMLQNLTRNSAYYAFCVEEAFVKHVMKMEI